MSETPGSISGLADEEAQEFHTFTWGLVGFTTIAVVATYSYRLGVHGSINNSEEL